MQDADSISSADNQPQESAEVTRLREELGRLKAKRAEVTDADLVSVLDMRIQEIENNLPSLTAAEGDDEPPPESEEIQKLRQELAKLEEKRAKTKDKNIIAVLDMRIMQIQPTLPPLPKKKTAKQESVKPEEEVVENAPPPTREEAAKAEALVKQSMLEKRRGNAIGATDLLKKAADAAPGSAVVLEALADDLMERKLTKQARETYKRALKLDPKNVGLERKYAQLVLQTTSTMSVEDQLRYGMSDAIFITGDHQAGLTAARFFTAIVPGVGQIVLGKLAKGGILLGAWILLIGWICLWNKDFFSLMKAIEGKGPMPGGKVFIPLIGMGAVWIAAMADMFSGGSSQASRHSKVDRPKPPVDLPFE